MTTHSNVPHFVRTLGVLSKKKTLEHLHTFPAFPVFLGCTDAPPEEDLFLDMSFSICRETGLIQLDAVPDEKILYQMSHAESLGSCWKIFTESMASFIDRQRISGEILEIGGGAGKLAHAMLKRNPAIEWLLVDPNPTCISDEHLRVETAFFNTHFACPLESFDAVIHSNVIEHMFDIEQFFIDIHNYLKPKGLHIFSTPRLDEMLRRGYTNSINFEHTICISEKYIPALLERTGFKLLSQEYYRDDHSLFVCAEKVNYTRQLPFPNLYDNSLVAWQSFKENLYGVVSRMNERIAGYCGPIFLFGAHIFSQYLIGAGLDTTRILWLLDNSELKHKKRLYGTKLISEKPDSIRFEKNPAVILHVAQYKDEIVEQLQKINSSVVFFE